MSAKWKINPGKHMEPLSTVKGNHTKATSTSSKVIGPLEWVLYIPNHAEPGPLSWDSGSRSQKALVLLLLQ